MKFTKGKDLIKAVVDNGIMFSKSGGYIKYVDGEFIFSKHFDEDNFDYAVELCDEWGKVNRDVNVCMVSIGQEGRVESFIGLVDVAKRTIFVGGDHGDNIEVKLHDDYLITGIKDTTHSEFRILRYVSPLEMNCIN